VIALMYEQLYGLVRRSEFAGEVPAIPVCDVSQSLAGKCGRLKASGHCITSAGNGSTWRRVASAAHSKKRRRRGARGLRNGALHCWVLASLSVCGGNLLPLHSCGAW